MTLRGPLAVVNNFLHDLATGVWFGVFIVMWRLARLASRPETAPLNEMVRLVQRDLFWWGVLALGVIILSGVARTLTYGRTPVTPELRAVKLRLLIGKHILLGALFGVGVFLEYTLAFRT